MKPHSARPVLDPQRFGARRVLPVSLALLIGVLWLSGCDQGADQTTEGKNPAGAGQASTLKDSISHLAGVGDASRAVMPDEIAASHILVAWTGVRDCPEGLQRTQAEAEERARRIALLLRTGRGQLDDLARRYSDDPTAQRNAGYLGVFRRGEMQSALEKLVASLDEGQIGGPVVTPYGWHVVRREPVLKVRLHHLLVAYSGAQEADQSLQRSRSEAVRIAEALHGRLGRPGADPCRLAASFSDDPINRHLCGDLGWIEPGLLAPEAERAVFALAPGEVSPVVESLYGFHIFWRP